MEPGCAHLDHVVVDAASGDGCVECLLAGGRWVHLRRCTECGHVGCCDQSPGRHATAHFNEKGHPVVQSYEPGQDWFWCYVDDLMFEIPSRPPSVSHP
jgi:hypothetical protein